MEENGRLLNNFSLQILSNSISTKNMLLGNKIRSLRDEQGILRRQVAALLEIDTPMFCKIERGDRRAKRLSTRLLLRLNCMSGIRWCQLVRCVK